MPDFRIFLSTVSSEFRSYRDALRQPLTRPNISVKVQEDFIAAGTDTLDKLDDYLRHCDAVVHLVGDMTGSAAKGPALQSIVARYPDLATRLPALGEALQQGTPLSYTQWEAYLAIYHRKKLLIAAPRNDTPRDPTFVRDDAQRAAQRLHVERLRRLGRHVEIQFDNVDKLTIEVLRSPIFDMLHAAEGGGSIVSEHVARQCELIRRHQLFGGRQGELDRLDALVRDSARSFHFVHGPSGFGKTALLANWVSSLWARGQAVVYQFINRLEGMADEHFALRNLCEQLAAWHGIVDPLPASVDDLRNVYVRLVQRQSLEEQRLVIVFDGLDEATLWSPRQLFPTSFAPGVHVVFSARVDNEESRNQWLTRLGLARDRVEILQLGRLDQPAIGELLRKAGANASALASDAQFVQAIHKVSGGDPFYLHFLVKDIEGGNLTRDTVAEQPGDLSAYFDQWLSQLHEDVDTSREEVYALIGFLSAALGPLKSAELSSASPILRKGMLLERELSGNLRRYLAGGRNTGYALCHPRFRDYLCSNVFNDEELAGYRSQLLAFCRKWREHRSSYALDHYVAHLVEEGDRAELYALIGADWKDARVSQTGSLRAFAADVEAAVAVALSESPPNVPEAIRCSLVYANITSFVQRMPVEAFDALARVGQPGTTQQRAGAAAARDYAALIREPAPRARAYCSIGLAAAAEGWSAEAADLWTLTFGSAERIEDSKERAWALLDLGQAIQRAGGADDLYARVALALEATAAEVTDSATLESIARLFESGSEAQKAAELRQRAKTARENEPTPWSLDFSGIDFSGLFPGLVGSGDASVTNLCKEADALLKEDRRSDALAALEKAELTLRSREQVAGGAASSDGDWLALAHAFVRAGDLRCAEKCAMHAIALVRASADVGSAFLGSTKPQRAIHIAMMLADIGSGEAAEEAARSTVASSDPGELEHTLKDMAKLAVRLSELQRTEGARILVGCIIRTAQAASAGGERASTLAALALAAAQSGRLQASRRIAERIEGVWNAAGDCPSSAQVLGALARVRALSDAATSLEGERKLAQQLSGLNRAKALALLAGSLGALGARDAAVACVNELVPMLGPSDGFTTVNAEIVLDAARSMIACGDTAWAIRNVETLLPLTRGTGTPSGQATLLGDIASVLAEAGERDSALAHGTAALDRSLTHAVGFLENLLRTATDLLCRLDENARAHGLVTLACNAIETMDRDGYDFLRAFPEVALAAGRGGCEGVLERLQAMANALQPSGSSCQCFSSLSLAFADLNRVATARDLATRALELMLQALESVERAYAIERYSPRLAEALARTGNRAGLSRLYERILGLGVHYQAPLLCGVIPTLGRVADKAALERIAAAAAKLRPAARSTVLAAVSSGLVMADDRPAARTTAQAALTAFEEERDGSITPAVLPLLVPALVSSEDAAGLLRLLRMPADKWPYEREWGPGLRLLLPALARLGVDDPDPRAREALARAPKYFGEAQVDLAEVQALRGLFEKAAATAASLTPPQRRAEAFIRLARICAGRGENTRAEDCLAKAAANLPALHNDIVALGEMALLASQIGAASRLRQELKQAFLRSTRLNLVSLDVAIFSHAIGAVAKTADEPTLSRIAAIVDVCGDPAQKAQSAASLVLALAKAGRFADFDARQKRAMQLIDELPDVADKARPLCDLAQALALHARPDPARDALLQALNAARHSGRDSLLTILRAGAHALCSSDRVALEIAAAIENVDGLWSADPESLAGALT